MKPIVYGIIPARSGSKGVVDKNIRDLGGQPMINWSIETSLQSKLISKTIISTDSSQYADIAVAAGATAPFLRPSEISSDLAGDEEWVRHALSFFAESDEFDVPDYIAHLRPTSPLRDPSIVDEAIQFFIENSTDFTSLRSVHEMPESAYKMVEVDRSGCLKAICSGSMKLDSINAGRQMFPTTYVPNGYIDVIDVRRFLSQDSLHGDRVKGWVTPMCPEIDDLSDLEYVRYLVDRSSR